MQKRINSSESFNHFASDWWNKNGSMKALHSMSSSRMAFIKERLVAHYGLRNNQVLLKGMNVLDIGCGGGIASEVMAKLGGKVKGIDISTELINIAQKHASENDLDIDYKVCTIDKISDNKKKFDIILALEVLEHVPDISLFIKSSLNCVKKGGIVFFSTINRNLFSYLTAILGAEYVLNLVPRGTHNWEKFIKPSEIIEECIKKNYSLDKISGLSPLPYPFGIKWIRTKNLKVNYIMSLKNNGK